MPSVIEAAMNRIDASSSFSPFTLVKRVVESTQMSRGMLKIRVSVMEFGRFTAHVGRTHRPCLDYAPAGGARQWKGTGQRCRPRASSARWSAHVFGSSGVRFQRRDAYELRTQLDRLSCFPSDRTRTPFRILSWHHRP